MRDETGQSARLMLCVLAVTAFWILGGCSREKGVVLVLGAYTAPREAYREIIPLFQKHWMEKKGVPVRFKESYLGSGAQSRAIVAGFQADVALMSLEADIERIRKAGLIRHDWKANRFRGVITTSVVAFAVREGNPKGITDWEDLAKPGVNVLTPNPKSSGGAMWNVLAAYGAAKRGRVPGYEASPEGANRLLEDIFKNVSVLDKGARESLITYEKGIGDVVITYEQEVLTGLRQGQSYELKIPPSTLRVENPVAVVDENAEAHGVKDVAEAFRDFLWSREAQTVFAKHGFRPVDPEVFGRQRARFPNPSDLWEISYLGDWEGVMREFFGMGGVFDRTMEEIQKERQRS